MENTHAHASEASALLVIDFEPGWDMGRAADEVQAGLLLILAIQAAHFIRGDIARRFFVPPEQSSISANFAMMDGASRQDTLAMMHELQRSVVEIGKKYEAEYGTNPVTYLLSEVGGNTGSGISGAKTKAAELLGQLRLS